jgi:hypothetical protein
VYVEKHARHDPRGICIDKNPKEKKKKNQDLPNGSQKNHSDIKKEYGGTRKKRELKIWGL